MLILLTICIFVSCDSEKNISSEVNENSIATFVVYDYSDMDLLDILSIDVKDVASFKDLVISYKDPNDSEMTYSYLNENDEEFYLNDEDISGFDYARLYIYSSYSNMCWHSLDTVDSSIKPEGGRIYYMTYGYFATEPETRESEELED